MNKKLLYSVFGVIVLVLVILYVIGSNMPDVPQQTSAKAQPAASSSLKTSATPTVQSPAYKLAVADLNHEPNPSVIAAYQAALDGLKPLCTEDEATLAGEIWGSWKDLVNSKVTDETNLSLIGHIRQSIPSDSNPTDCRGFMAAYLVLREPK